MRTFEWTASLAFPSLALLWGLLLDGSCQTLTCHALGCSGCLLSFIHWLTHSLTHSFIYSLTCAEDCLTCLLVVFSHSLFPTLCDHMDCSPLGSTVHGISQVRILAWAAISLSRHVWWRSHKPETKPQCLFWEQYPDLLPTLIPTEFKESQGPLGFH